MSGGGETSGRRLLEGHGRGDEAVLFPLRRRRLEASMAAARGRDTAAVAAVPASAGWGKKKRVVGLAGTKRPSGPNTLL
jgi:hypothetical protein